MGAIDLRYGSSSISIEYPQERFTVLGTECAGKPMSDAAIGEKLEFPVGSDSLDTLGSRVLIVVPDATRDVGCGQVLNVLVRRLIAAGTEPSSITIIFATGIHRAVSEAEKSSILTPFIAQRIKTLSHGPRDLMQIVNAGTTSAGIAVELNRALFEYDHVILIGGVTFHYFAGFTGGRKLVCPGLASSKTTKATHKLAFDCDRKTRRSGVGPGRLDGNAVHEAFVEAAGFAAPAFAINTIVNASGDVVDLYCGNWIASHRAACEAYAAANTIKIAEKRELVIASCGGYPHDIDIIQAHKSLAAAADACVEGGKIILIAECMEGTGRSDFLTWFENEASEQLANRLCDSYHVNGQTAWSLLTKNEKYQVSIMSGMEDDVVRRMRMSPIAPAGIREIIASGEPGYIIPNGAKYLIETL